MQAIFFKGFTTENIYQRRICNKNLITLIQYTLGAGGVEALVLAGIKISKVLSGEKIPEDV